MSLNPVLEQGIDRALTNAHHFGNRKQLAHDLLHKVIMIIIKEREHYTDELLDEVVASLEDAEWDLGKCIQFEQQENENE